MNSISISHDSLGNTNYLLGSHQATLAKKRGVFLATYFKNNREVLNSGSSNHPTLPKDKAAAEQVVQQVIELLEQGLDPSSISGALNPKPKKPSRSSRRSQAQAPSAIGIIETLFNLRTPNWTLLVPVGKPQPYIKSRVIIQDASGDTVCEIPYSKYLELLKV